MRKTLIVVFAFVAPCFGQAQPEFEVASISDAPPLTSERVAAGKTSVRVDDAFVGIGYKTLQDLLCMAFRVRFYQQILGPDFLNERHFDIRAKIPEGAKTTQVPEMLQSLLRDRFGLVLHHESRPIAVYVLTVRKGVFLKRQKVAEAPKPVVARSPAGSLLAVGDDGTQRFIMPAASLASFADCLSGILRAPVLDETQMEGRYRLWIDFPVGARENGPEDPGLTSAYRNLSDQGLRLEPKQVPMDALVIDSVRKTPTAN